MMMITSIKAQFITLTWLEFTIHNMLVAVQCELSGFLTEYDTITYSSILHPNAKGAIEYAKVINNILSSINLEYIDGFQ